MLGGIVFGLTEWQNSPRAFTLLALSWAGRFCATADDVPEGVYRLTQGRRPRPLPYVSGL